MTAQYGLAWVKYLACDMIVSFEAVPLTIHFVLFITTNVSLGNVACSSASLHTAKV